MLIGLSNVSKLLQNSQFPVFSLFGAHFCYHSNGKSQINTRYLHLNYCSNKLMRRKCWTTFFIFSFRGGKNSLFYSLRLCPLWNFSCSFVVCWFFQNQLFWKILSRISSECQTDWIQIRPDVVSDLIWVQSVCKGYEKMKLVYKELMCCSVRVYAIIISKYATKIVGMQNRQVACVHRMQDHMQSTFNKFKPAQ